MGGSTDSANIRSPKAQYRKQLSSLFFISCTNFFFLKFWGRSWKVSGRSWEVCGGSWEVCGGSFQLTIPPKTHTHTLDHWIDIVGLFFIPYYLAIMKLECCLGRKFPTSSPNNVLISIKRTGLCNGIKYLLLLLPDYKTTTNKARLDLEATE